MNFWFSSNEAHMLKMCNTKADVKISRLQYLLLYATRTCGPRPAFEIKSKQNEK